MSGRICEEGPTRAILDARATPTRRGSWPALAGTLGGGKAGGLRQSPACRRAVDALPPRLRLRAAGLRPRDRGLGRAGRNHGFDRAGDRALPHPPVEHEEAPKIATIPPFRLGQPSKTFPLGRTLLGPSPRRGRFTGDA